MKKLLLFLIILLLILINYNAAAIQSMQKRKGIFDGKYLKEFMEENHEEKYLEPLQPKIWEYLFIILSRLKRKNRKNL